MIAEFKKRFIKTTIPKPSLIVKCKTRQSNIICGEITSTTKIRHHFINIGKILLQIATNLEYEKRKYIKQCSKHSVLSQK